MHQTDEHQSDSSVPEFSLDQSLPASDAQDLGETFEDRDGSQDQPKVGRSLAAGSSIGRYQIGNLLGEGG